MDIFIKNAKYFDSKAKQFKEGNIGIKNGQIIYIKKGKPTFDADIQINAAGKLVLPGFIDLHAHLRDFEYAYKETYATGTKAAIHGGVTTVFSMPNSKPPLTSWAVFQDYLDKIKNTLYCNVGFICGYPEDDTMLKRLKEAGIYAVKIYMEKSLENHNWMDDAVLLNALSTVCELSLPLYVHAGIAHDPEEDREKYLELINKGKKALEAHSVIYSDTLEKEGIEKILRLSSQIEVASGGSTLPKIHFCHISSKKAIDCIIEWRKKLKGRITCEATPHHLLLFHGINIPAHSIAKVLQPLRTPTDNEALLNAFINKDIDIIASDHAPHAYKEKFTAFLDAKPGFPVLDIYVPLILTCLLKMGVQFHRIIEGCCEKPAELMNIQAMKGKIERLKDADIIIVEKTDPYCINYNKFCSQAKLTPYEHIKLEWKVTHAIVNGDLQIEEGEFVGQPKDRVLTNKIIELD
ncbi:MAG: dihydroorotase [Promethearchaeota archaeon]